MEADARPVVDMDMAHAAAVGADATAVICFQIRDDGGMVAGWLEINRTA